MISSPDPTIARLLAEHALGLRDLKSEPPMAIMDGYVMRGDQVMIYERCDGYSKLARLVHFDPVNSLDQAVAACQKMRRAGKILDFRIEWNVCGVRDENGRWRHAWTDEIDRPDIPLARALCIALLRALGVDTEEE